ncbi:hypothetical protein [Maridesulfovibrio sp.]|nr:hypothetical protein [Maridesulfovibrio sp.]
MAYEVKYIGSLIIKHIMEQLEGCNVLLYAPSEKEAFNHKHVFCRT